MCPWVGPHAPSFGLQLWGLPSRVEYLSPPGVLLPLVYATTASPLWLELRGHSAWQATPSWAVYRLACHRLLPWLRLTFSMVPDAAWPASDQWPWSSLRPLARWVGWVASVRPVHGVLVLSCPSAALRVCSVLGRLAPVHRCARAVCCVASAVSWATWLLFTGVLAPCVVLRVRCPGPLGSRSPVCALCAVRVCHGWLCPSSSPPNFRFFFLFFFSPFFCWKKKEKQGRAYTAGTGTGSWCGGAIVLCPRCCGGGRAPGVRLARPDVHGHGPGWVWLGVSLLLELAG